MNQEKFELITILICGKEMRIKLTHVMVKFSHLCAKWPSVCLCVLWWAANSSGFLYDPHHSLSSALSVKNLPAASREFMPYLGLAVRRCSIVLSLLKSVRRRMNEKCSEWYATSAVGSSFEVRIENSSASSHIHRVGDTLTVHLDRVILSKFGQN